MPRIIGVATATPPHEITQEDVSAFAQNIYDGNRLLRHMMPIFENSKIQKRYFIENIEWYARDHSFTEINDRYIESALDLTIDAVTRLSAQCKTNTEDYDVIFFISTTGISTPTLDAKLFNRIPMNRHIKRIPVFGLGCAGGAAGLARAHDYLLAYPTHRALIVTVEICSLAFQKDDPSKSDIISIALFGDGAAACMMAGDQVPQIETSSAQPSTLGSFSTIYPKTEEVMNWRITSDGFRVGLSKDIPSIVTSLVKDNVAEFISHYQLSMESFSHFIMHPGGMKVLDAYASGLNINPDKLKYSIQVLNEYGNMSSCTVYFVLKLFLENTINKTNEHGLLGSLGPGFSSELVLLKWD